MHKIYFLRTAPYAYLLKGADLYDSFDLVATRKKDVGVLHQQIILPKNLKNISCVFSSPTKRSKQTAAFVGKSKILESLYEVEYSMHEFITKEDFFAGGQPNVTKARKAFVSSLITNKLQESYSSVIQRVETTLAVLSHVEGDAVVFTHGFFLKIIEAYIHDKSINTNFQKLLHYFSGDTETFHFLEGFTVISHSGQFTFKDYVKKEVV